jgi:putative ABC transport system ATP-binding protein
MCAILTVINTAVVTWACIPAVQPVAPSERCRKRGVIHEGSGKKFENKRKRATELLDKVDLDETLAKRRVLKLSGGEQQRVAIARALSFDPDIILADEPTGNLDLTTQEDVIDIFKRLAHEENKCVIIVSHSPEVAASVDEVYELASFRTTKKRRNEH